MIPATTSLRPLSARRSVSGEAALWSCCMVGSPRGLWCWPARRLCGGAALTGVVDDGDCPGGTAVASADLQWKTDERKPASEQLVEVGQVLGVGDRAAPAHHVARIAAAGWVVGRRAIDAEGLDPARGDPLTSFLPESREVGEVLGGPPVACARPGVEQQNVALADSQAACRLGLVEVRCSDIVPCRDSGDV